ncbi:hypothetical protein V8C35DRAFT_280985 [Trichoderma chlorosporum]
MTGRVPVQTLDLPLKISKELCAGRTYIVTGANVGLGLEAARHLVGVGASKVILAVRNLKAGEAAKKDVEASTGINGVAEVWHLDLSSYASVRAFASKAVETLERIDAIIENAAVAGLEEKAEGHHLTTTVNVISTFLLAVLLLPKLRSDAAKFGYPASKMMEILAVREIAKLLPVARGGVIVNLINPGLCETNLSRNAPEDFKASLRKMLNQFGRSAECGSRTLLAGAVGGKDSHGSYMDDCVPSDNLIPSWMDATANQKGWESIVRELEKIEPGCVSKALD